MPEFARRRWILPALVGIGFVARLALAIALGLNRAPEPGSDQQEYDTYAWNVAQGRGYRGMSPDVADQDHLTAYRPPGTSLVWAGVYAAFGHRYDAIRIAHCLLAAAAVLLTYAIGRRCFGEAVGLLAAAAYAVYPTAVLFGTDLLSEPLGTLWLLWSVLACLQFAERPSWGRAAAAGLLLGLGLLTRANTLFLVPLLVPWAVWQFRGRWRTLAMSAAIPIVAVAVLVPWAVRNYLVFHSFIPFSTMGGSVLLQGNNRLVTTDPMLSGSSVWDTKLPEYREALASSNDELVRDRRAKELAVAWLKSNPDKWVTMVRDKLWRALTPFLRPHSPRLYRVVMLVSWGPVLVLSALAFCPTLWRFLRTGHPGWLLHLAIAHFLINSVIFFGYVRYRAPVEPFFLILATVALISCVDWIRAHAGRGEDRNRSRETGPVDEGTVAARYLIPQPHSAGRRHP